MTKADADPPRDAHSPGLSRASAGARGDDLPRPSAIEGASEEPAPRGCPFLVASTGGWRLGMPSREHRCAAVSPPAALAPEKQIRLCLTPSHTGCATYLASLTARTERLGATPVRRATRWGLARTTSVIEDPGGLRARLLAALLDRRRWPAIPAVLLVTTLFVLALSGFRAGVPTNPVATASPRPASPGATPRVTPRPSQAASPSASFAPSASAAASPRPSPSFRTYRVESGDSLSLIASRFDTTVKALTELNDIEDPSRLKVGEVLLIP